VNWITILGTFERILPCIHNFDVDGLKHNESLALSQKQQKSSQMFKQKIRHMLHDYHWKITFHKYIIIIN
jgi:hypothetical protein